MSQNNSATTKSIKDLNLIDAFLFNETTENPDNTKIIAKIIIRRVLGFDVENI